ncbi:MAG: glutathione S-transferase family protein [Alphaproteobacteria bacterium]|nr:glutathione S-transferase family protein [Alphaproteobacteria bacterium]
MLTLYTAGLMSCSLASHIALEEAGAEYRVTQLDFKAAQQQSSDYLKINPKGRVPALVTERGVITETPAILFYIGQTHPRALLIPGDVFAIGQLQDFNSYLCSTVHPNHAHGFRGYRWSDDPTVIEGLKVKVAQNMRDNFAIIETDYLRGPWVLGQQFTVSDIYLYTIATWLESDGVDVGAFPKVKDHRIRMSARPAVQRVRATYA